MKQEVLYLMSHLIITLAFIGVYLYTTMIGAPDETIKTVITVIVGYWFGAMGSDKVKNAFQKKTGGKNE